MSSNRTGLALGAAVLTIASGAASATELTTVVSATNGTQSARATFVLNDDDPFSKTLSIVLENTADSAGGPAWLTGLFFDLTGSPELDFRSAAGQMMEYDRDGDRTDRGDDPADYWGFDTADTFDGVLPFGDQHYGLGAAGFDVFGRAEGDGSKLKGVDGGILPSLSDYDDLPNGHAGRAFVDAALTFEFDLPATYDIGDAEVKDVAFAWGSGFDEVVLTSVVPLPAPALLGLAGLAGLVLLRRRGA